LDRYLHIESVSHELRVIGGTKVYSNVETFGNAVEYVANPVEEKGEINEMD